MNRSTVRTVALIMIVFVLGSLVLTACGGGLLNSAPRESQTIGGNASSGLAAQQPAGATGDDYSAGRDQTVALALIISSTSQQRIILKNATLSIVVEAADETLATISKMADEMGGWVVSSSAIRC